MSLLSCSQGCSAASGGDGREGKGWFQSQRIDLVSVTISFESTKKEVDVEYPDSGTSGTAASRHRMSEESWAASTSVVKDMHAPSSCLHSQARWRCASHKLFLTFVSGCLHCKTYACAALPATADPAAYPFAGTSVCCAATVPRFCMFLLPWRL